MTSERLQKLIAASGLASRRAVEQWITAGRITVNGQLAKLGDRANALDQVCLDGKALALQNQASQQHKLLLYHKPVGEVTTRHDPQARPTVFERLPKVTDGRWIVVGRLDVMTSGLLLFTTDGALAHYLMHPSSEIVREYRLQIAGQPSDAILKQLRTGVMLDDGPAKFDSLEIESSIVDSTVLRATLHEGRNREIRRMCVAVGCEVQRLMRLRFGPIVLPTDLPPGRSREADIPAEFAELGK
jgi:23S rRNA pseudouridine2605 synthase